MFVIRPLRALLSRRELLLLFSVSIGAPVSPHARSVHGSSPVGTRMGVVRQDTTTQCVHPPADSVITRLATITTDTGDFRPGHRDFTRSTALPYRPMLACLIAAQTEALYVSRTLPTRLAEDSLRRFDPARDTLPARVAEIAWTCGRQFLAGPATTVAAATPAADLPTLFALALVARNDSLAQAVSDRALRQAANGAERTTRLVTSLEQYLSAHPARVAAAEGLVAYVDTLAMHMAMHDSHPGLDAGLLAARRQAHARLLAFYTAAFDRAAMRREAEHEVALTQAMAADALRTGWGAQGRRAGATILVLDFLEHPTAVSHTAQRLQHLFQQPAWQDFRWGPVGEGSPPSDLTRLPLDSLLLWASAAFGQGLVIHGGLTSPLRAAYWPLAHDSLHPLPGTVALFITGWPDCLHQLLWTAHYGGFYLPEQCDDQMHRLARWQQQYGPLGLRITLLARTRGYSILSGTEPPLAEAANIARYIRDDRQLPIDVAVDTVAFPLDQQPGTAVLTDRTGHLVYRGPDDNPVLDWLLARTLPGSPATTLP